MGKSLNVYGYPDPPESKQKCFVFDCVISGKARVSVYANDKETAEQYCTFTDCDDFVVYEYDIEYIDSCSVEE